LTEGEQGYFRPGCPFAVGNALIAGCSVIGDSVSHIEFIFEVAIVDFGISMCPSSHANAPGFIEQ
jgi:hypothetical protein